MSIAHFITKLFAVKSQSRSKQNNKKYVAFGPYLSRGRPKVFNCNF